MNALSAMLAAGIKLSRHTSFDVYTLTLDGMRMIGAEILAGNIPTLLDGMNDGAVVELIDASDSYYASSWEDGEYYERNPDMTFRKGLTGWCVVGHEYTAPRRMTLTPGNINEVKIRAHKLERVSRYNSPGWNATLRKETKRGVRRSEREVIAEQLI